MNSMLTVGAIIGIAIGLFLASIPQDTTDDELRQCLAQASANISEVPTQDFSRAHAICFNAKPRNL